MPKKPVKKAVKKKAATTKAKTKKAGAVPKPKLTTDGMKAPDADYLNRLLNRLESLSTTASSAAGDISNAIDLAYEQKGVDKKALSILRMLRGLPTAKVQVTVPHLLMYIDMDKKLQKNLTDQAKMEFERDKDQTDLEDKINGDGLPKGSRPQRKKTDKTPSAAAHRAEASAAANQQSGKTTTLTVVPKPQQMPKADDDTMDDHDDIPASA